MALPPANDASSLALALDAFMAEHRRCCRLYGEGLDSGEDGAVLWIDCGGCGAAMTLPLTAPKYREEERGFYKPPTRGGSAVVDFVRYYDLERYLFEDVHQRFHAEHSIGAFDLFSIVIWKANRAKSRIAKRLLGKHGDLEGAARRLSAALWDEPNGEARLRLLMSEWGFLLPMASAILTVLWPDEFTVYDVRACETLADHGYTDFSDLANRSAASVWDGYDAFRESVRRMPPAYLSLRDKDRYLWGYSRAEQLKRDIQSGLAR